MQTPQLTVDWTWDKPNKNRWKRFESNAGAKMDRPLRLRIKYGFNRVYKPVLDDAAWRAFDSMEDYRKWCEDHLPEYLGYRRPA